MPMLSPPVPALRFVTFLALALLTAPARADLADAAAAAVADARLGGTQVGLLVTDARTGRVLVALDADRPMVPASNMKLVTTAAALHRLGPDFKFTTRLQLLPGPPQLAQGDDDADAPARPTPAPTRALPSLLIRGDGDPAFGDPTLLAQAGFDNVDDFVQLWVDAALATGSTRFDRLLVDDSIFDTDFTHPDWPDYDLPRRWCAQVAGLSFYDNVLDVRPVPAARAGAPPAIEMYPFYPDLQHQTLNRAKTSAAVDDFVLDRLPGTNRFVFRGSVRFRREAPFQVTVHDPPLFFAHYLRHRLALAGVTVGEPERVGPDDRLDDAVTLHAVNTTLAGVVDRTNQDSQNMFAESLLKRMGHQLTRDPGSFANGSAAVQLFLKRDLGATVNVADVEVADGSGMSRHNRVTARLLVALLIDMYQDPALGPAFTASLSHAGHNGTLRKRLDNLDAQVYGKSGYLGPSAGYASALSGYLVKPAPTPGETPTVIAFSMLFNGFSPPLSNTRIKALQDDLLRLVDRHLAATPTAP